MKILKQKLLNNSVYIFFLFMVSFGMAIYVSVASSNVPIMDYWRFINVLVEKSFMGGTTFFDLYSNNGVHRSAYELFLFLVNVKIFHHNTQVSMYIAILIMMCTSIILYKQIKKIYVNKWALNIVSLLSVLLIYSLGAYEIITQEFATPGALRILFFMIAFVVTNNIIREENDSFNNKTVFLALFYIFVIDIIGGAYAIGLSITIAIVLAFHIICKKVEKEKINLSAYLVLYMGLFIGDFLYLYGLQVSQSGNLSSGLGEMIVSFFKGLFVVSGVSLFGTYRSLGMLMVLGIIITIIHMMCLIAYIGKKMYKKTYLPLLLYIYTCGFYGMIFIGRSGNGIEYLASSRYITDAIFALLADLLVVTIILADAHQKKQKYISVISYIIIALFFSGIISTDVDEIKRAPYRKQYADNLIEIMLDIDNYSDEDLAVFQAQSPEQVRHGVELMKKYKLGVFYYDE